MEKEIILYKCNGKAPCSVTKDGKKNKYCRNDIDNYQCGCFLTTDPKYAIDKNKPIIKTFAVKNDSI